MYCCENCFNDSFIKETIKKDNNIGNCDFCSSKNVYIINISDNNAISEKILRIVQSYSVSDNRDAKPLKEALRDDWDIFSGGCETILTLVKSLCANDIDEFDDVFTKKVIISQMYDDDFQRDYGLLSGLSWNDFSEHIKYKNRFHNTYFNADAFASILTYICKEYDETHKFYRARICENQGGYNTSEMLCPPKGKRRPGRINPEEIGILYLSSDKETILYETRANIYDYITIGEFKAKKKLRLVDLSGFSKISPFLYEDGMIERFAINRVVFRDMAQEIAKPVRRYDSPFEYLPTQYIAEFIKSQGYDGVAYESTIYKKGYNYALFDESLVECITVETVEITGIEYKKETKKKALD